MTTATRTSLPSGRAGSLDGLPSGTRRAVTWLDTQPSGPDYCYQRDFYCRGPLVTIHTMRDHPDGGQADYDTAVVCAGHGAARHGLHPDGEPTESYIKAIEATR